MYYCIKRTAEDIAFDQSFGSFNIGTLVFDIVKAPLNTGLDSISEFIVDDNNVIVKSDPRLENEFKIKFEKVVQTQLQELLFG